MTDIVSTGTVRVEGGRVGRITLDSPERRNAMSVATMTDLTEALKTLEADQSVRAIVLAAEGTVFSAGHYLPELIDRTWDDEHHIFEVCSTLMLTIEHLSKPVIAAVQGPAFAAGCQLVASCDLAVSVDTATFATPGVKIGLFCSTPMVALSRNVGQKRAMHMLLTGKPISAATALDWGLVNDIVPADQLIATAESLAESIAVASTVPVGIGKRAFYEQLAMSSERAYEQMSRVMAENAVSCDAQEGIQAFLEKREPVWQDK